MRRASAIMWALGCATAALGCDALVGGQCQAGYHEDSGLCVPDIDDTVDTGAGGADFALSGSATGSSQGGSSGSMANTCEAPLAVCAGDCVDLTSDFDNCGACGVHCPTELCEEGVCVGDPVGHLVTIGMSYAQSHASSQRVLGNAVFRTLHNPTRILEYREYALPNAIAQIHTIIDSEAQIRNRAYEIASASLAAFPDLLASGYYDVVLVHDGAKAPSGMLASVGNVLGPAIADFAAEGGTVVATATGAGAGEMCELLGAAGILTCSGFVSAMDSLIHNQLPGDVIGNGVLGPFVAKPVTSAILTSEPVGPDVARVFVTDDDSPVVIHKITR